MFDLKGKTALVTGATGGIGGEIAKALHAQGAIVAVSAVIKRSLRRWSGTWVTMFMLSLRISPIVKVSPHL